MTRKAKIGIAVAMVLAIGVVVSFLRGGDEGQIQVSYLRVSSAGPHRVLFVITNTTKEYIWYNTICWPITNGVRVRRGIAGTMGTVGPTNWTMFSLDVPSFARWSPVVAYRPVQSKSSLRVRLAAWAEIHDWYRISEWLRRSDRHKQAVGPEMLGNQPAPSP